MITADGHSFALWFFFPLEPSALSVKTGKPSQHNLFLQVRHHYAELLEGEQLSSFPNPGFWGLGEWKGRKASFLTDMRKELMRAGAWGLQTPEFLSRGGSANSPAQRKARQDAVLKARAARSSTTRERHQRVLQAVAEGRSHAEIAKTLGIKPESVVRLIHRAKQSERGSSQPNH